MSMTLHLVSVAVFVALFIEFLIRLSDYTQLLKCPKYKKSCFLYL